MKYTAGMEKIALKRSLLFLSWKDVNCNDQKTPEKSAAECKTNFISLNAELLKCEEIDEK